MSPLGAVGNRERVTEGSWAITAVLALLVAAAALVFRIGLLQAPGEFDEYYHLLAARGWLETGRPTILDGEYWRASLFTRAVAALFALTGQDDLATGRLISVAAATLLPVVLFLWLNRVSNRWVALLVAALVVVWPQAILEAQFVRFYSVHVLAFVIGTAAFHLFITERGRIRFAWLAICLAGWFGALEMQISTVIGIFAALGWGTVMVLFAWLPAWRSRAIALGVLAALGLAVLAVAAVTGLLEEAWRFYRWTAGFAEELRDYYGFYHANIRRFYGLLWWLTPFLAVAALVRRPALGSFALAIFFFCFLVHSFGGMKALRYLSYAMPFLFVVWILAAETLVHLVARRFGMRVGVGLVAAAFALVIAASSSFLPRSLTLAQGDGLPERGDWRTARTVLGDWAEAPFIATTHELHMLANIGTYDLLVDASRVTELNPSVEFGVDPRTGRPVIGEAASFGAVLDCKRDGLLVTVPRWWSEEGWETRFPELLAEHGLTAETRAEPEFLAIRWHDPTAGPGDCTGLPF